MTSPTSSPSPAWWERFDPFRSLPAAATLFFGASGFALVLIIAAGAGKILHTQIERQLGPAFENLAFQIADKLDRTVYERTHQLQFTAKLTAFRTADAPLAERQTILESLHDASTDYAWIGFADAKGTILAASQRLFIGEKMSDATWFRGGRLQTFVGGVREFPELASELPTIGANTPRFLDLGVPVTSAQGTLLGVLGAQVRWSWAREVQRSVIPESARREHLGVTIYAADRNVLLDSGGSGWTEPPDPPASLSENPGVRGNRIETTSLGTVCFTGYARSRGFRDYRGQGWLVVVRQPVADAFAAVQDLRHLILRLGTGLVVALSILCWTFSARFERRLRAVGTAAGRIGGGDVLALLPQPRGATEFDRMCSALGDMLGKFRQRQETLEAENARLAARQNSTSPLPPSPPV